MKNFYWVTLALFFTAFIAAFMTYYPKLVIMSGYTAKVACSCVFISEFDEETIYNRVLNFAPINLASYEVDYDSKIVTASVFGLYPKTAIYREGTGCALVADLAPEAVYQLPFKLHQVQHDSLLHWYDSHSSPSGSRLASVIQDAFTESDPTNPKKNTRAVVVIKDGQLIGEQYAPNITKNTPLLGWSMTKSLTSTIFGMLYDRNIVKLDVPTEISEWHNDDRKNITWRNLLQMNSGLRWKEEHADLSDAVTMLFDSDAIGKYAKKVPVETTPGHQWIYSSGTTNILSTEMQRFFDSKEDYIQFAYDSLFDRLGMYSLTIETDAVGDFVGSSYGWANARDWAKIGQLYLQKGVWANERVLSEEWVNFVQLPAEGSEGLYGGHFWVNSGGHFPDVPLDAYSLNGFHSQRVMLIPSKGLVIVRLGTTYHRKDFDFNAWYADIISAVDAAY